MAPAVKRENKERRLADRAEESSGVRVIQIQKKELTKNPFRYLSDPPRLPGEKRGAPLSDEADE